MEYAFTRKGVLCGMARTGRKGISQADFSGFQISDKNSANCPMHRKKCCASICRISISQRNVGKSISHGIWLNCQVGQGLSAGVETIPDILPNNNTPSILCNIWPSGSFMNREWWRDSANGNGASRGRYLLCWPIGTNIVSIEQELSHPSSHSTDPHIYGVCHQAWRLFHLAQFLELTPIEVHELSYTDISTLLEWLDLFPQSAHGPVWLEAYEDVYRERLLKTISGHQAVVPATDERPRAQGIFCIDARSESFRRHLEAQGPYETFGYAGFFGVPMSHVAFDSHDHLALCPILLTPKCGSDRSSPNGTG